jgi:inhibitor of KinA
MRIVQLGESLIIMKELTQSPATIALQLNQNPPPGLHEAVPAFDQLALYFDPEIIEPNALLALSTGSSLPIGEEIWLGPKSTSPYQESKTSTLPRGEGLRDGQYGTMHTVPALYQAEDLEEIAQTLNLTVNQLIQLHSKAIYTVEAIGFCPGFPYLSGLPPELQNLPRRQTPRTKVEPGTIAITGDQCCIYPLERPGGWNLIAQTPLTLVDPETDYFPLQTGDTIQFQPITKQEFDQMINQLL